MNSELYSEMLSLINDERVTEIVIKPEPEIKKEEIYFFNAPCQVSFEVMMECESIRSAIEHPNSSKYQLIVDDDCSFNQE